MTNQRIKSSVNKRVEVTVLFVILCGLAAIFFPALEATRESARRMSCRNNFLQIGIAFHNYHAAFKQLPPACGGTGPSPGSDLLSNQRRLSALVALTPFIESSPLWHHISSPYLTGDLPTPKVDEQDMMKGDPYYRDHLDEQSTAAGPLIDENGDRYFPAMGPAPWRADVYPMFQISMPTFRCPSDHVARPDKHAGLCNYALCYGDGIHEVGYRPGEPLDFRDRQANSTSQRGVFVNGVPIRFSDITDGLGSTVAMAEVATYDGTRRSKGAIASNVSGLRDNPSLCYATVEGDDYRENVQLRFTPDGEASRGGNWADGAISWSGITTVLPPNSPSCDTGVEHRLEGVFSASSRHLGGCHVLMTDGAVFFITNSINTGDLKTPSVYESSTLESKTQPSQTQPSEITSPVPESPYGLWGALGSRAGAESVDETLMTE